MSSILGPIYFTAGKITAEVMAREPGMFARIQDQVERQFRRDYQGREPVVFLVPPQAWPKGSQERLRGEWTAVATDDPLGWAHSTLGPVAIGPM